MGHNPELRCNVLVLGAGSSADFGIPIGADVLNAAIARVEGLLRALKSDDWPFNPNELATRVFRDSGDLNLKYAFDTNGQFDIDLFFKFHEEIHDTHCETLDNFAFENRKFGRACRYLTAAILIEKLYKSENGRFNPIRTNRNVDGGSRRNWIDKFISVARKRIRDGERTRWSIINFNYDFIFEQRLRQKWRVGSPQIGEVDEHFEFVHPHGRFLPAENVRDLSKLALNYADQITYVHETADMSEPLNTAYSRISKAKNIYIMGFACAEENSRLVGLIDNNHRSSDTVVFAQNFSGNQTVQDRLVRAGAQSNNIYRGFCDALIDNSFFGEVPV